MPRLCEYKIIVGKRPTYNERRAAAFIIEKIKVVTGYAIPILTDDAPVSQYEMIIGHTEREAQLGIDFCREQKRKHEYAIKYVDGRLFVTGFGPACEIFCEPYGAYAPVDDGGIGTLYAAFRFVERVLGCDHIYVGDLDTIVDRNAEDIIIDERCELSVTAENFSVTLPELYGGAAVYFIPSTNRATDTSSCVVFKSRNGELTVYDGGRREDAHRLVELLEYISVGKKPTVSAWLISRLGHVHSGALCEICENDALKSRIDINDVYVSLLSEKFYCEIAPAKTDNKEELARDRKILLNADKHLGASLHTLRCGDEISVGEILIRALRVPTEELCACEKVNLGDSSVVYKVEYDKEQSILLLGDAEKYLAIELETMEDALHSDVLLVGNYGRVGASIKYLEAIGADVYVTQTTNKVWYSDESNSARVHVYRLRRFIRELGKKRENVYRDSEGIVSFELPVKTK